MAGTIEATSKNVLYQSSVYSEGNVIIGDSNVTNITVDKPVFQEINFDDYDENAYATPRFTGKILSEIKAMKLGKIAVFTGFYGFDKTSFSKHIAYRISEDFITAGKNISVKECSLASDYYGISATIRAEKGNTVFILNNISPKDVNHNLDELRQSAIRATNEEVFIIVNTNLPFKAWPGANPDYWFIIEQEGLQFKGAVELGLYTRAELLKFLLQSIALRGFTTEYRDCLKETLDKVIPSDIKTPEQISILLDLYTKNKTKEEKAILDLVQKTKKKEALISQWFNALEDDKKLIALGMTLLDGLYDGQFFSMTRKFIADAWEEYNHELKTLDYADLAPLMHFFSFSSFDYPTLESKFPNQRFQTLSAIWDTHRRRINAVLPSIVRVVEDSVSNQYQDWELYGTYEKRVRLREVLSDVLSDIGRLSPQSVEYSMLQLASHDNMGVQIVVARALAGWCESYENLTDGKVYNRKTELFELLDNWYSSTRLQSLIDLFREGKGESQNTATTYLRATISLTLGYASVYDEPNCLSKSVLALLQKLIGERNDLVVQRNAQTLRLLLRNHPRQVGGRLFELSGVSNPLFTEWSDFEQFSSAIANGLSDAQSDFPEDVEDILNDWIHYIKSKRPDKVHTSGRLDYRERVIIILCFTLSKLGYKNVKKFTVERAAEVLFELRSKEHHPYIRSLLLDVILNLYERFFTEMEARHSNSIPHIDVDKEIKPFATALQQRYLRERSEQTGGDYWVELGKHKIDTWINADERPNTEVEEILDKWVNVSNNNAIIMVAAQSLIYISKVDSWERTLLTEYLENRKTRKTAATVQTIPNYRGEVKPGFWAEVTNWISGKNDKRKNLIDGIIRENKDITDPQIIKIFKERLKTKPPK